MAKTKGSTRPPRAPHTHVTNCLFLQRGVETLCPDLWLEIFSFTTDVDSITYDRMPWKSSAQSAATTEMAKRTLSSPSAFFDPSQPLRIISHVCRYWRAILSDASHLWSQVIDCGYMTPMWLSRVLHYANDAPLVVRCSFLGQSGQPPTYLDKQTMDLNLFVVLVAKNEFREFHRDFLHARLSFHTIAALLNRFRHRMPQLTALSLNPGALAQELFNSSPVNLFQGTAPPKLKRATLVNCPFSNYQTQPWQNLTYLSISNNSHQVFLPLSLLQQTPALEHLVIVIYNSTNLHYAAFFPARGRVKLPNLSRIQLSGALNSCIMFLCSLEPPLDLTLLVCRITEYRPGWLDAEIATIFHGITSTPDTSNTQASNTIRLDLSKDTPRIRVRTNNTGHKHHFTYEDQRIELDANDHLSFMECFCPYFHSCTCLIFETQQQLDSNIHTKEFYANVLLVLLPQFVNVEVLALPGTSYSLIFPLLADVDMMFPNLREVIMPFTISREAGYLDQISNFLTDRRKSGRPIATLSFPTIHGSHKSAKSNKRARMLKKSFGVDIKFREEDPWMANLKDEGF
ncbi:hypothetical protein HYPSUDRAFT_33407 [Hypholoma sublateritium FD-334 SS-4]|uniref:F-box domain-containing protein n=1 Tax=Hypholoma sublateritium (strain FD-334 SS-4) TaxID=945553 RepID=A0A0D2PDK2_HYPSF|nr:hypothetical protein HYPSUDRAFT_33407 [Hypholoma sublateritium FD-334 SS-4]